MHILFLFTLFLLGTIFGSFLNVLIVRMHTGQDMVRGRSMCPQCCAQLRVSELIPIVSFFVQRGACRHCLERISWQYPLVECATGLLFVMTYHTLTPDMLLVLFGWVIVCFLTIIFVYDLRYGLILDRVTLPAIVVALLFHLIRTPEEWQLHLIGTLLGAAFFLLQYVVSRGQWIGGGDIRMGALMGAILGWQLLIVALLIAYVLGAIISLFCIACRVRKRTDPVPFAPYLSIATVVVFLWGERLFRYLFP